MKQSSRLSRISGPKSRPSSAQLFLLSNCNKIHYLDKMNLLTWAKISVLVSLAVFLGFGSYLFYTSAQSEKAVTTKIVLVLNHANSTLTKVDSVVARTGTAVVGIQQSVAYTQGSITQ